MRSALVVAGLSVLALTAVPTVAAPTVPVPAISGPEGSASMHGDSLNSDTTPYRGPGATAQAARDWWNSPEYTEARKIRQSCADARMLLVDGPAFDPSKG